MLSVKDLIETDHLGLAALAGDNGVDRQVLWTHVAEIEDAADWLDGGELLMTTGLGIPAEPDLQVAYINRLVEVGAAGLVIGHRAPEISAAMRDGADKLGFPVMRLDVDVPFLAISRLVAASNTDTAQSRVAAQVRIYDSLRSRIAERRSLAELFDHLGDISGYKLYVVSEKGRALFPDLEDAPAELQPMIPGLNVRSPAIPGGVGVPIPLADRIAAYLLAIANDSIEPAGLGAVRHIATIAALELSNFYRERDEGLQRGAEALSDLLDGRLNRLQADRTLAATGLEAGRRLILVALKNVGDSGRTRPSELHHRLLDAGVSAMLYGRPDVIFVLIHDNDVGSLEDALQDTGLHAGLSEPFTDPLALALARMQAMWAVQRHYSSAAGATTRFKDSGGWMTWLPHDVEALTRIVNNTLAPITAYDEENGTELIQTLRVFFRNERSLGRTAEELYIHKHTLQYRLRRIRDISGRSMTKTQDVAELWFTFQAEALLRPPELDPDA